MSSIRNFLLRSQFLSAVYVLLALITAIQLVSVDRHRFKMPTKHQYKQDIMSDTAILKQFEGQSFTAYNNYTVFKNSFSHLRQAKNLYTIYPGEQWDIYKYSPTFALLMAPLASLPDIAGLFLWNLLNAMVLLTAIRKLQLNKEQQSLLLLFIIPELLTNLQNAQSNALLAGLIITAYACMERGKNHWAALWLVFASFIKIYGAAGFCLFLFYPDKLKFIFYAVLWTVLLFFLPLLATPFHLLIWQYQNWQQLLASDRSASYGLSVMGWLHSWFGLSNGRNIVMAAGIGIYLMLFTRWRLYRNEQYRLLMLSATLIWVVIFNYKAESPTFIIAITGAAIWFFSKPRHLGGIIMLCIIFVFTCLVESDIFSNHTKEYILEPYTIKAIPCIIVWVVIVSEILSIKKSAKTGKTELIGE